MQIEKTISYLAGAVTGALVGATLVVLFTPASGESIRSDLRNRLFALRDQMRGAAAARRAEMEAELEQLRAPRMG